MNLMKAIYNDFAPTGAYSIEFRRNDGSTIAEPFFAMPPESVDVSESERSELQATLGGGFYSDHGNEFKEINVAGSLYFYTIADPARPIVDNAELSRDSESPNLVDGFTEFVKLRYILHRYRDYTMTRGGKVIAPAFSGGGLSAARALREWVADQVESGKGALANNIQVIWHDYDCDDHFLVKVSKFSAHRDKKDINTITYNIGMEGYRIDERRSGQVTLGKLQARPAKSPVAEQIRQLQIQMDSVSPDTRPQTIPVSYRGGGNVVYPPVSISPIS